MTRRHGVVITNTAYGDTTIAEYAFALLLGLCHRVEKHSDYIQKTKWWEPDPPAYMFALTPQIELYGKTMGVIGLGKIGMCTARIAQGFGMRVISYDRFKHGEPEFAFIEQQDSLEDLLRQADVISVHAPLTAQTTGLINKDAFALMKDGVLLINTARGPLIAEDDLADALESGKVAAAGLDVLVDEPPKGPSRLLSNPNVLTTGHIAWLPKSSRMRQVTLAVSNYKAYLAGKPVSVINAKMPL